MSLTSDGKRMIDWAKRYNNSAGRDKVFTSLDDLTESYYEQRAEKNLLCEYDFDRFAQVKAELETMWGDESVMKDMILISSVSAMKHKPADEKEGPDFPEKIAEAQESEFEIPEYVYVF